MTIAQSKRQKHVYMPAVKMQMSCLAIAVAAWASVTGLTLVIAGFPFVANASSLMIAKSENIAPPTTKLSTANIVSPVTAWGTYGGVTTHTTGISLSNAASPEIKALARALLGTRNVANSADATAFTQNVFDYVRNNINTEFRYGLSKGGRGALIDQSGTPYDQAELMVNLLMQGGVTATYAVGEATVSPAQFGVWAGLTKTLTDSNQTFTIDARAACQFLADGGIPATVAGASSCSSVTGLLGDNIVMSHIWVIVNGVAYDPAYKAYTLRTGVDVPAAMGCGTQLASTCGNSVSSAGMSGATPGTTSGGVPYIDNYNVTAASTANNTLKANLANYILTQNINGQGVTADIWDALGGKKLNPQSIAKTPLAYTQRATWAAIPNQFRTKLNIKVGTVCGSFYADEIAGRALAYQKQYLTPAYYTVDNGDISTLTYTGAEACSATPAPYIQIFIDHPYAANSGGYADEIVNFKPVDPPSDETGFYRSTDSNALYLEGGYGVTPPEYLDPMSGLNADNYPEQNYLSNATYTIVHEFGQGNEGSAKHMSDLAAVAPQSNLMCGLTTISRNPAYRHCHDEEQATVAGTFQTMRTLTDRLVDGVAKTVTTRHHDVGIIYGGRQQGLSFLSVQESMSVAPQSGLSLDQQSGFDMQSLILGEAEARANAIDGAEGISAARAFFGLGMGNSPSTLPRVYDIAPSQMAGYLASIPNDKYVTNPDGSRTYGYYCINYLEGDGDVAYAPGCWRKLALQDVANQGYSTLITQGAEGELFYNGTSQRALTMWEYVKGGASVGDSLSTALKSADVRDEAALRRKSLSVSPSSGELKFAAEPDIVTGTGDFPYSLPFIRTFTPSSWETQRFTSTYYYTDPGASTTSSTSVTVSTGPDAGYHDRLFGGWVNNYQVINFSTIDLSYALGSEDAYLASEMIANLQVIKDLGVSSTLTSKLGSLFTLNNMDRTTGGSGNSINTSIVRIGANSVVFHKTFDGKWFAPQSPTAQLVSSPGGQNFGSTYTSSNGEVITFSPYRYDQALINPNSSSTDTTPQAPYRTFGDAVKYLKADAWSFPNGVRLTFVYAGTSLSSGSNGNGCTPYTPTIYYGQYGSLLSSVSNNLGHTLTFQHQLFGPRQTSANNCNNGINYNYSYRVTSVSDETGRTASFNLGQTSTGPYFSVTGPTGDVTRYEYGAGTGTDSPNPAVIVRNNYQLRRWFTPGSALAYQTINYDDLFRVSTVTDRNGHVQTWYPSGMFGSELWKRTELMDGEGNVSLTLFDDKNGDLYNKTPMGRVTTKTFDNMSQPLRTVMPEGNAVEQAYDVRGNVLRDCKIAKARAGLPCDETSTDIVTKTTYKEGPTVLNCTNRVTCDKPASETDAMGKVTNYTWDATTGNLTQILLPADRTGVRPQTDAGYTACLGVSLLTNKTEKISSSQSVVTAYTNDAANHCVLKQVVTDSGGANLTTALTFDAIGNLTSVDGTLSGTADMTTYQWYPDRRIKAVISPDPDGAGAMLRKEVKYTYNDDGWITQTDTGTATAADGSGFNRVTSEIPTYDAMGNKVQSKVVKP